MAAACIHIRTQAACEAPSVFLQRCKETLDINLQVALASLSLDATVAAGCHPAACPVPCSLDLWSIDMLFIVGGIQSQSVAAELRRECARHDVLTSVVAIPKSIDKWVRQLGLSCCSGALVRLSSQGSKRLSSHLLCPNRLCSWVP